MAKKDFKLIDTIAWVTGILVSLSVGFGMIGKTLTIPFLSMGGNIITVLAGWIVVIGTIVGLILAIFNK